MPAKYVLRGFLRLKFNKEHSYMLQKMHRSAINIASCMCLFIIVNNIMDNIFVGIRTVHHAQDVVDHIYGILVAKLEFLRTLQVFF